MIPSKHICFLGMFSSGFSLENINHGTGGLGVSSGFKETF